MIGMGLTPCRVFARAHEPVIMHSYCKACNCSKIVFQNSDKIVKCSVIAMIQGFECNELLNRLLNISSLVGGPL